MVKFKVYDLAKLQQKILNQNIQETVYFSPLADIENGDFKVKVKHDDLETGTIEFAIQKSLRSIMIGTKTFSLHLDLNGRVNSFVVRT